MRSMGELPESEARDDRKMRGHLQLGYVESIPDAVSRRGYTPLYERGMWESVRPIKDADYYLRRLIEDGHQIVIVTASAPETVNLKLSNVLFRYFPYFTYEDVIITSQKSLVNGDILIDDGPHKFINWSHDGILMSAPHNRGFDAEGFGLT